MRRVILILLLTASAGCRPDGPEIVRYRAPHIEPKADNRPKDRILAALVADKNKKAWSFYMAGPEDAVEAHSAKFFQFLDTVKFGDEPPLTWKTPEGWREEPGNQFRYKTLKTDAQPKTLDVSIMTLTNLDVLANVNRWRGMLSLGTIDADQLAPYIEDRKIDGQDGYIVKLTGRLSAKGGMPPMMKKPAAPPKSRPDEPSFQYDLPAGWVKVKPSNDVVKQQFAIVDGDQTADVQITALFGNAGGMAGNLQRWRGQLKLPPKGEADIQKIEANGAPADLVDLTNPELKGTNRFLIAVIPHGEMTYFLKIAGPSELVGKNKDRFTEMAKSLRIK